ncbi:hypothetical protein GE061_009280 [Apolygus lucorum]|uniref:FP protein C-terminal domain-containing protein n=1 Tax=Apolygus lucorum TaxID=248454 RepID=A0A6A4K680_APOLU|nr:hypothetical protein GE061_009280 [Apolygus lucorum]
MSSCGSCLKGFANNAYRVKCIVCVKEFHLNCHDLKKEDYLYMRDNQKTYTCPSCTKSRRGSLSSQDSLGDKAEGKGSPLTTTRSTSDNVSTSQLLQAINSLREEVKSANIKFDKHVDTIKEELKDIKLHLNSYSDLITKNAEDIGQITTELSTLTNHHENMKIKCSALEARVVELEGLVQDNEQAPLNNSIEISGVPSLGDKDALDLVKLVGSALNVDISEQMINNCFRRRPTAASSDGGSIFLSFVRKTDKDAFMKASRGKRNLTSRDLGFLIGEANKIYINHSLTFAKRKVLNLTKTFKREHNYKFVWISNGNILVKKDEREPPILIKSPQDIKKLESKNGTPVTHNTPP